MDEFKNENIEMTPATTLYIPKSSIPNVFNITLEVYNATPILKTYAHRAAMYFSYTFIVILSFHDLIYNLIEILSKSKEIILLNKDDYNPSLKV